MSIRQRWPLSSSSQISHALPRAQPLLVPMCTLCRNGQPIVGMPGLEGADVQAVAAHGLVPAVHTHVTPGNTTDSPSAVLPPGIETRDLLPGQLRDMPHRAFYIGGNVPAASRESPRPPTSQPGYIEYLQDRKPSQMDLGLSGMGPSMVDASVLMPHHMLAGGMAREQMLAGGVAGEEEQQQMGRRVMPAGFPIGGMGGLYGLQGFPGSDSVLAGRRVEQSVGAQHAMPRPSPRKEAAEDKNWFVIVVDEARRDERGFKLLEVFGAMRLDNSCSAIEWRRSELGGVSFDAQTFVKASTLPAQLALGTDHWVPVRTIRGKMRGASSDLPFLMVEQEEDMVTQLYDAGSAGLRGGNVGTGRYDLPGQDIEVQSIDHRNFSRASGDVGGQRMNYSGSSDGALHARTGEKRPAEACLPDAMVKKGRGRKSSDGRGHGGKEDGGEGEEKRAKGQDGEWRCEVCNIIFSSSQALGGHRINSTDHKQNLSRLRRQEQEGASQAPGEPRLSKNVYSNPPAEDRGSGRRARLPSMAQMPGFLRVLRAFPIEVGTDICVSQSPTAYFSSCRLELFRRHTTFGALGSLIIDKYFTECWMVFERIILDPKSLPELADVGIDPLAITEEQLQDLLVFMRMLRTKKKSLDINRRAVSKRIKGLQTDGAGGSPASAASPGLLSLPSSNAAIEQLPHSDQVNRSPSSSKPPTTSP